MLKKRIFMFLSISCGLNLLSWAGLSFLTGFCSLDSTKFCWIPFYITPILASAFTKIITKDHETAIIKTRIGRCTFLLEAFILATIAVSLGLALCFIIFPKMFDNFRAAFDMDWSLLFDPETIKMFFWIFIFAFCITIILLLIPAYLFSLGWYSYFYPLLSQAIGKKRAAILSGLLIGISCWKFIELGIVYGIDYWGAPFSGMLLILIFTTALSVCISFFTSRSSSLLPPTIFASITLGTAFFFPSYEIKANTLLASIPEGLVGMSGFVLLAAVLLCSKKW